MDTEPEARELLVGAFGFGYDGGGDACGFYRYDDDDEDAYEDVVDNEKRARALVERAAAAALAASAAADGDGDGDGERDKDRRHRRFLRAREHPPSETQHHRAHGHHQSHRVPRAHPRGGGDCRGGGVGRAHPCGGGRVRTPNAAWIGDAYRALAHKYHSYGFFDSPKTESEFVRAVSRALWFDGATAQHHQHQAGE